MPHRLMSQHSADGLDNGIKFLQSQNCSCGRLAWRDELSARLNRYRERAARRLRRDIRRCGCRSIRSNSRRALHSAIEPSSSRTSSLRPTTPWRSMECNRGSPRRRQTETPLSRRRMLPPPDARPPHATADQARRSSSFPGFAWGPPRLRPISWQSRSSISPAFSKFPRWRPRLPHSEGSRSSRPTSRKRRSGPASTFLCKAHRWDGDLPRR